MFSRVVPLEPPLQIDLWVQKRYQYRRGAIFRLGPDNQSTRRPKKTPPIWAEFSVTPVLRVRIVGPLVATTALKVVRKTPPCASERGRQSLDVLESAERVSQDHF